jgi:hypothetical protein
MKSLRVASLKAETRNHDLLNSKQDCYPLNPNVLYDDEDD